MYRPTGIITSLFSEIKIQFVEHFDICAQLRSEKLKGIHSVAFTTRCVFHCIL